MNHKRLVKSVSFIFFIFLITGSNIAQPDQTTLAPTHENISKGKEEVYRDIEKTLGVVPSFFKLIPERSLKLEWELFKTLQLEESPIPHKYRELIGVAISAVTKCRYCSFFHTEVAKLFGATDEEIEDAVHYAKSSAGWSAYINGMQVDYDEFKDELLESIEYVKNAQSADK